MKKFTGSKSSEEASYVKLSQKYEPEESNQQIEEIKSDLQQMFKNKENELDSKNQMLQSQIFAKKQQK